MTRPPVPFFDRKDLRPNPSPEEDSLYCPTLRSRSVCLSPSDWRALGDALKQVYPGGRYMREATQDEIYGTDRPADDEKTG